MTATTTWVLIMALHGFIPAEVPALYTANGFATVQECRAHAEAVSAEVKRQGVRFARAECLPEYLSPREKGE